MTIAIFLLCLFNAFLFLGLARAIRQILKLETEFEFWRQIIILKEKYPKKSLREILDLVKDELNNEIENLKQKRGWK